MLPGKRHLLYFSYIGTNFRGAQKQKTVSETWGGQSVQGLLERVLSIVFPHWKYPNMKLSSRTDQGTHAFMNTGHMDLDFAGYIPAPAIILASMNKELRFLKAHDIKINGIQRVPLSFHCRFNVHKRLYMYRLAVVSKESSSYLINGEGMPADLIPFPEICRTHVIGSNFDPEIFKRVLNMFCGTHNFTTFMGSPSTVDEFINPVKTLNCWLQPGRPLMDASSSSMYQHIAHYYEVYFESRSFLYRQVRRLMGTAIRVAEGHMSFDQVQYMLSNPSRYSWDPAIYVAPAYALYLKNIFYRDADLEFNEESYQLIKDEEKRGERLTSLKKFMEKEFILNDESPKSIKKEEISN